MSSGTPTVITWKMVPPTASPAIPSNAPDGSASTSGILEGWTGGYIEFVWDAPQRTLTSWITRDGLDWHSPGTLDLTVWKPALAGFDKNNPGTENHDSCSFSVLSFEEGPNGLLLRGQLDCAGGCGEPVLTVQALWTSTDSLVWTPLDMARTFGASSMGRISGGSSGFVAVGKAPGKPTALWFSGDARQWSVKPLPADASAAGSKVSEPVSFAAGFVLPGVVREQTGQEPQAFNAVGCVGLTPTSPAPPQYRGVVWWSPDGSNWTRADLPGSPLAESVDMYVVKLDEHLLMLRGQGSRLDGSSYSTTTWVSRDGRNWTVAPEYPQGTVVLTGRDRGLLYILDPANEPANTYFALDDENKPVLLQQRGDVPDGETVQMAFGPAGLMATQMGSTLWLGTFS